MVSRTLTSIRYQSLSGLGSNRNEGVLRIPKSSRTRASSLDCLVSYRGHSLHESKSFNENSIFRTVSDLHISQKNSYSPVCVCMCFFKVEPLENADLHTSQENGFSPVCVRM